MRSLARDLYVLQQYIVSGQDPAYREQVKQEKLAMIDKLQGVRLMVIDNMKTFEYNLLRKSIEYFILRITPYRVQLTQSLSKLVAFTGTVTSDITRMTTLLSGQIQTIDKLAAVQTFDELIPLFNGYLYFQKQIS